MKGLVLLLALSVFPMAANALGPLDFEGNFDLVRGKTGLCESTMNIYRADDDENFRNMFVGSYFFRNVNGGTYTWDDYWNTRVINTYTRGNTMVSTQKIYEKAYPRRWTRTYSVTLSKNGSLKFVSRDSLFPNIPTVCFYKRVPRPDPNAY